MAVAVGAEVGAAAMGGEAGGAGKTRGGTGGGGGAGSAGGTAGGPALRIRLPSGLRLSGTGPDVVSEKGVSEHGFFSVNQAATRK